MSVNLTSEKDLTKMYNTLTNSIALKSFVETTDLFLERKETAEDLIGRAIWYAYVANITAFNVQYKGNYPIDFDMDTDTNTEEFDTLEEAISCLKGLMYNTATNDGNVFLMDMWTKFLRSFYGQSKYGKYLMSKELK